MKNFIFTLLFLGMTTMGFAQKNFTEKMFSDLMERYKKETVSFLKTDASPDFMFLGSNGQAMNYSEFLAFVQGGVFLTNEFTNIKIRQYDNTAIVTAIWAHSHQLKHDNSIVSYKELVTEVFNQQKGKWMMVSHQGVLAPTSKAEDEAAIKAVIEKETATWQSGDTKAHADCWQVQPYGRIFVTRPDGTTIDRLPNFMINPPVGLMGGGGSSVNTNYRISINGNTAWSSHDQETTAKDGKKASSLEMRMLEKINGAWKIVGESIHHLKTK
jgi:hypothetical protein